jgi:hypothetical protein
MFASCSDLIYKRQADTALNPGGFSVQTGGPFMSLRLNMPGAFAQFPEEGAIIGRLIVGYGQLEWDLCLLVGAALNDWDTAVKAMFRSRGESQRLSLADALARQRIPAGKVRSVYEATISDLRLCLKLRNQYAHTQWSVVAGRILAFINIEDVAGTNDSVNVGHAPLNLINLGMLQDQERFFAEVSHNLEALNWATQASHNQRLSDLPEFIVPVRRPEQAQVSRSRG